MQYITKQTKRAAITWPVICHRDILFPPRQDVVHVKHNGRCTDKDRAANTKCHDCNDSHMEPLMCWRYPAGWIVGGKEGRW